MSTKHLDAIVHSGLSTIVSMSDAPDVIHYHALGPGLVSPLPRYFSRSKVVLTVHGLDHQRAKWDQAAQAILRAAAWMSAHVPDATIGVSSALVDHYRTAYGRSIDYIPNGVARRRPRPASEITSSLRAPSRLLRPVRRTTGPGEGARPPGPSVPSRPRRRRAPRDRRGIQPHGSIRGAGPTPRGDGSARADDRIRVRIGARGALLELCGFVLPSSLEGRPLTLLEAISFGSPVVVSDIPPHVQIVGEDALGRHSFPMGDDLCLAGRSMRRSNAIRVSTRRRCASPMRSRRSTTGTTWREPQKTSTND